MSGGITSERAGRPRLCRLPALRGLQEATQLPVERQNASAGLRARGDKHAVDEVEARLAVRTDGRTHLTRRFHEDIIQEIEQRSRDLRTRDTVHPIKYIDDLRQHRRHSLSAGQDDGAYLLRHLLVIAKEVPQDDIGVNENEHAC